MPLSEREQNEQAEKATVDFTQLKIDEMVRNRKIVLIELAALSPDDEFHEFYVKRAGSKMIGRAYHAPIMEVDISSVSDDCLAQHIVAFMLHEMRNIIDEDEYMIRNIGHVEATVVTESKETEFIPLPNGHCSKSAESGLCKHANACYACRMFRPSKSCLPIYEAQLREAEGNITVAELNGYERLLEINTDLKNNLTRIISKLKEET